MKAKPPFISTTTNTTVIIIISLLLSSILPSFSLTYDAILLLSFKLSITTDPLNVLDSWSSYDATPCSWRGVVCSNNNTLIDSPFYPPNYTPPRVVEVTLPGYGLHGTLPANLGLLDRLQTLNLSSNFFNGSLPATLFTLPELRLLDLSNNSFSGDLLDSIGGLRSLQVLNLSENALLGNIPRNLATLKNLTSVSLRGNYFTGNIPTGFTRVRVLDLSSNIFNGSLPADFGGKHLRSFNLSYNQISGNISRDFGSRMPGNATLDFSFNNLAGEIPDSHLFVSQERDSFAGNPDLCGPPLVNPCPIPSSPTSLPPESDQPIPPPAFAAMPKTFTSSPNAGPHPQAGRPKKETGLQPHIIAVIVVGDLAGVAILVMILLFVYKRKNTRGKTVNNKSASSASAAAIGGGCGGRRRGDYLSSPSISSSSTTSESKGIAKWSCLRKGKNEEDDSESGSEEVESQRHQNEVVGQLVTVENGGEKELEIETLLKASAYILGASGTSIMYKAVLEDGSVLAVRRVGESNSVEKLKEFEGHVRAIGKMVHQNLVKVRGFYWGSEDKLLIYEYVSNGSLANARYRKSGSSPCHMPWAVRLRIAKGIARGLCYIHEKKHAHGNLKPNNILLDAYMEPKISDFGLERLTTGKFGYIPGGSTRYFGSKRSTSSKESFQDHSVGATPSPSPSGSSIGCVSPYHPPESLRSLKPNSKWDVYSFGVVLLELVTGKVVISDELGPSVLAGLAVGLEDRTRILRMADPTIRGDLEGKEETLLSCLKLGYNCISHAPQKRPSMKEALHVLEKMATYCSTPSSSTSPSPSSSTYYDNGP